MKSLTQLLAPLSAIAAAMDQDAAILARRQAELDRQAEATILTGRISLFIRSQRRASAEVYCEADLRWFRRPVR